MSLLASRSGLERWSSAAALKNSGKIPHKPMITRVKPNSRSASTGSDRDQNSLLMNKWPPTLSFHTVSRLPDGGFSELYVARCRAIGKVCALKVLKDSTSLEAYRREAAHLQDNARLSSPFLLSLVVAFDVTKQSQRYLCIATDYYECGDLHTVRCQQPNRRISVELAKFYCIEIALGIEHLHERKIIHRDVKPENILVNRHGHVAIADFDMAVKFEDRMVNLGGTVDYMSPERLDEEQDYGYPSDWWSLGITMYTLVFGYHPTLSTKLNVNSNNKSMICREPFVSDLMVCDFIQCLLERDPAKRLGTTRSVLSHHFLGGTDGEDALRSAALRGQLQPPMIPKVHTAQGRRNDLPANKTGFMCYTSNRGVYLGKK